MLEFEKYVKLRKVKIVENDNILAKHILKDAENKYEDLKVLKNLKLILENSYDVMREAADAVLTKEGYKSYSHEASIVFLWESGVINNNEKNQFNRFRKLRNESKYEGGSVDKFDSESCYLLARKILKKIEKFLK
jgi:uncharacterized protein YutE (UPF0331/DUF86 family)